MDRTKKHLKSYLCQTGLFGVGPSHINNPSLHDPQQPATPFVFEGGGDIYDLRVCVCVSWAFDCTGTLELGIDRDGWKAGPPGLKLPQHLLTLPRIIHGFGSVIRLANL